VEAPKLTQRDVRKLRARQLSLHHLVRAPQRRRHVARGADHQLVLRQVTSASASATAMASAARTGTSAISHAYCAALSVCRGAPIGRGGGGISGSSSWSRCGRSGQETLALPLPRQLGVALCLQLRLAELRAGSV
jgi:hypothetical protein